MEEVLGHPGALCFPVKPDTSRTMVDVIAPDDGINSSMKLDAADLCAGKVVRVIDVMALIVLNY